MHIPFFAAKGKDKAISDAKKYMELFNRMASGHFNAARNL
jgi:hypothetical protein